MGQVEVRELALCIHSQEKVLLSCVPSLRVAPTQLGHRPLWLWESADWQWDGLPGTCPAAEAVRSKQPSDLSQAEAATEV